MAFRGAPDRDQTWDVLKWVFGSRVVLTIVFVIFFLGGIGFVCAGGAISVSIGTSLIASALISLATLMIDQIRNGEQMRAADLARAGLLAAYERRDLQEYEDLVRHADQIDVAGYTLKSFSETNEVTLRERGAARRPIKVRALLVDPDCEAARLMEQSENLPEGTYTSYLHAFRTRLAGVEGVEIRTTRRHLPMMIYRIDRTLYTGPFPMDGRSRMALTLKLGLNGWLFERQQQEFDSLWEDAAKGPLP